MAILRLIPYAQIPNDLLFYLRNNVEKGLPDELFRKVTASSERLAIPDDSFVQTRNQYRADDFISDLVSHMPEDGRAVGVIDKDLFSAKEEFVLGLAERGRNAIVALPRLREEFYGRAPDEDLFRRRAITVILHELGLAMKLETCDNECVMQAFSSVRDLDSMPQVFCSDCTQELRKRYVTQIGEKR